jgi:hypothetical protein
MFPEFVGRDRTIGGAREFAIPNRPFTGGENHRREEVKQLEPSESDLIGHWVVSQSGNVEGDDTTRRIRWLVSRELTRLATDASGWDVLFRDPRDGRLWELTYPESERHGGGPPRLTVVAPEEAITKYGPGAVGVIGDL